MTKAPGPLAPLDPDLYLPATLLLRYLFFLDRRPISASNRHFLTERTAGLRALAGALDGVTDPRVVSVAARVRALTPLTLPAVAREAAALTALLPKEVAGDVLVTSRPPDPGALVSARRVRVVMGPAIGIGDETICVDLPAWIRAATPDTTIELWTTRPELWRDVAGPTTIHPYAPYSGLLAALREEADLVLLVDFERPAFAAALSHGPAPRRYAELAIGTRTVDMFDSERRRLHSLRVPAPYYANYYDFVAHAARWLGAPPLRGGSAAQRAAAVVRQSSAASPTIVISPFTSKQEPSPSAWSALLATVFSTPVGARLVFDPGAGLATERFAAALMSAVRAVAAPGVTCELASDRTRTLDLPGVLALIRGADAVICADTFAAHVAPLAGCTTLVVASQTLRHWRVPQAASFYFDDAGAPAFIGHGMRRVMSAARLFESPAWPGRPWFTAAASDTLAATAQLANRVAERAERARLLEAHDVCGAALRRLLAELPDWPKDFDALLTDRPYGRLLPVVAATDHDVDEELQTHISHLLGEWRNSNLHKYLTLAREAVA